MSTSQEYQESIEKQFEEAYEKYSDAIFRHCYFRVFDREQGKELMQEAFMRAWTYLADGKTVDNMRAFLYRIANNLIIDYVRKKKEISLDDLQMKGIDPGYDATAEMQRRVDESSIMANLVYLEKDYREALVMRYIDGLSPAEIAQVLGESANTISVRLHRGLKQLRSHLNKGDTGSTHIPSA
ncbi:MAG: polymerase sigma factor, sigma-70 family [Candidatus Peribacteria bacterium]|nr:polymerase sigma factor, sigma-70 family [Candidatus Peribacteria bacterium]